MGKFVSLCVLGVLTLLVTPYAEAEACGHFFMTDHRSNSYVHFTHRGVEVAPIVSTKTIVNADYRYVLSIHDRNELIDVVGKGSVELNGEGAAGVLIFDGTKMLYVKGESLPRNGWVASKKKRKSFIMPVLREHGNSLGRWNSDTLVLGDAKFSLSTASKTLMTGQETKVSLNGKVILEGGTMDYCFGEKGWDRSGASKEEKLEVIWKRIALYLAVSTPIDTTKPNTSKPDGINFCGRTWPATTTKLMCRDTSVVDLTPIQSLTQLERLDLQGTQAHDLQPLESLKNLWFLNLRHTAITSTKSLFGLESLKHLNLANTEVNEIEALATTSQLRYLNLSKTNVHNLQPLSKLHSLRKVNLRRTKVRSLNPLKWAKQLRMLDVRETRVRSFLPICRLMRQDRHEFNVYAYSDTPRGKLLSERKDECDE